MGREAVAGPWVRVDVGDFAGGGVTDRVNRSVRAHGYG